MTNSNSPFGKKLIFTKKTRKIHLVLSTLISPIGETVVSGYFTESTTLSTKYYYMVCYTAQRLDKRLPSVIMKTKEGGREHKGKRLTRLFYFYFLSDHNAKKKLIKTYRTIEV